MHFPPKIYLCHAICTYCRFHAEFYSSPRNFSFKLVQFICIYIAFCCSQLCSGVDENAAGACAQLVFAPIDESFGDEAPLLPSGFRVIPLDPKAVP